MFIERVLSANSKRELLREKAALERRLKDVERKEQIILDRLADPDFSESKAHTAHFKSKLWEVLDARKSCQDELARAEAQLKEHRPMRALAAAYERMRERLGGDLPLDEKREVVRSIVAEVRLDPR